MTCFKYTIKKMPLKHAGLGRVLVKNNRRDDARRHDVVKIKTNNGEECYAAVIGHNDDDNIMKLDLDIRNKLALKDGDEVYLCIEKANFWGQLKWYCSASDPHINLPARLAVLSAVLGSVGLIMGVLSLLK